MKTTSEPPIVHAHDKFVRTAMADPRVAHDFFMAHLPEALRQVVDLKKLELQPRSYIDDVRKETTVDMLYKTKMNGHEGFLYLLLEHQSKPDKLMPFRMLKYTTNIMAHYLETSGKQSLPLIYPMMIYHGERPYPYSTDIKDIVNAPQELIERYFLKPFQLIDLSQIVDEELKQHAWAGAMEWALKHIVARDIIPYLQEIAWFLRCIDQAGGRNFISTVLQYLLERSEMSNEKAFFELINAKISPEIGENIMSLAERLEARGEAKGLAEGIMKGKIETAERMLAENIEIEFIAKVTGLSLLKIKEIQQHK